MTEMQAQNTRTATAAHHATQQSQHATQQSAETQPVIKQVASQASIHGQVLPKIASQPNLDEITTPLLSGASSASASSSQT